MTILSCGFTVQLNDIHNLKNLVSSMLTIEHPNDLASLCCETISQWERSLRNAKESNTEFAVIQIPNYNNRNDRFMWEILIYRTYCTNWGILAFRAVVKAARFCS